MADPIEPSPVRLLDLHAALVGGDRLALDQIWVAVWHPICRRLRRHFPRAREEVIIDAFNDAIVAYAARPRAFDSARHVPLDVWLSGIAAHKLLDRFRGDQRRSARDTEYEVRRRQAYGDQVNGGAIDRVAARELRGKLPRVCDLTECAAMAAWLNGHDTAVVAARLGLSHLPRAEQRRAETSLIHRVVRRFHRALRVDDRSSRRDQTRRSRRKRVG